MQSQLCWFVLFALAFVPGTKAAEPLAHKSIRQETNGHPSQHSDGEFVIRGNIQSLTDPVRLLILYENSTETQYKGISDTVDVQNGKFIYRGSLNFPTPATIYILKNGARVDEAVSPGGSRYFFLDKGSITIEGKTLQSATIRGSASQKLWQALQSKTAAIADEKQKEEAYLQFVRENPDSYVSWAIVKKYRMVPAQQNTMAMAFFNALSDRFKNTSEGQKFLKSRERLGRGSNTIGSVAPDFARNDVNGNPIKLSSFRGRYVFLEFWASWCGPCRAESPFVKKAYNLFKEKNFDVFAVSFDESEKAWKDAIIQDKLPWSNVSSLKGLSKDDLSISYAINMVPRNYLLDPNGVIVAIDLRGKELEQKLCELIGNPAE